MGGLRHSVAHARRGAHVGLLVVFRCATTCLVALLNQRSTTTHHWIVLFPNGFGVPRVMSFSDGMVYRRIGGSARLRILACGRCGPVLSRILHRRRGIEAGSGSRHVERFSLSIVSARWCRRGLRSSRGWPKGRGVFRIVAGWDRKPVRCSLFRSKS